MSEQKLEEKKPSGGVVGEALCKPGLDLCDKLGTISSVQRAQLKRFREENSHVDELLASDMVSRVQNLAELCGSCSGKLREAKREMAALTERTEKLKKRCAALAEKKRRYDEDMQAKEAALVASAAPEAASVEQKKKENDKKEKKSFKTIFNA